MTRPATEKKPRRLDWDDLGQQPAMAEAAVPRFVTAAAKTKAVTVNQIAANPLNTRRVHSYPKRVAELAASIADLGQMQPCPAVTREAFLAIYPEFEERVGAARYVQVAGGMRLAATIFGNRPTLDLSVRDEYAADRITFLKATSAENIERSSLDPIEEAEAIALLAEECGTHKEIAEEYNRSSQWVSQRLNLLKLIPELQELVRDGRMLIRDGRRIALLSVEQQQAEVQEYQSRQLPDDLADSSATADGEAAANNSGGEASGAAPGPAAGTRQPRTPVEVTPEQRARITRRALTKLGGTPEKIAGSIREGMPVDDLRRLIALLQEELPTT